MYDFKDTTKSKILGLDISKYAKRNTLKEISNNIKKDLRNKLNYQNNSFDLVISINTLHNLKYQKYIILYQKLRGSVNLNLFVESYRNEQEQFNLQCWALTAETLIDTTS